MSNPGILVIHGMQFLRSIPLQDETNISSFSTTKNHHRSEQR